MNNIEYRFTFRDTTEKAKAAGILANAIVEVVVSGATFVKGNKWVVRSGTNGIFFSSPSESYEKDGQKKWINYMEIWPKPFNEENQDRLAKIKSFNDDFQRKALEAYQAWSGGSNDAMAPSKPKYSNRPAQSEAVAPAPEWNVDSKTGRKYRVVDGSLIWADAQAAQPAQTPSVKTKNNPFAGETAKTSGGIDFENI